MATPKRKRKPATTAGTKRRKRVGAVVTTKTTTRKRKSVGAIFDDKMPQLAGGMALSGIIQGFVQPMLDRVLPEKAKQWAAPVIAIAAYKGSEYFKSPLAKGICLGVMKTNVDETVKLARSLVFGMRSATAPAPAPAPGYGGAPSIGYGGNDFYLQMPALGQINGIEATIAGGAMQGGELYTMPNYIGACEEEMANQPYMPLGADSHMR